MTDRVRTLTVTLERDYRDDDVQTLVDAIAQLRGVDRVDAEVLSPGLIVERHTATWELRRRIDAAINDVFDGKDKERG